jgi:AcrR family transcriptional regulator
MLNDIDMAVARLYRQDLRAQQTLANTETIVRATVALITKARRVSDITLDDIARESGLTVRSVLRRFGSREKAFEAAFVQLKDEFGALRVETPPGDVDAAIRSLLDQYERIGTVNIRALREEEDMPLLHRVLDEARGFHRDWLRHIFAPHLAGVSRAERERRLTALYAATDVYLWKLLRQDLKCDRRSTLETITRLVQGVLNP